MHVNFQIQAKDDFIGGNVIPTNGSDSGIYLNDGTTNTKPFPQPSVNVKLLNHTLDNKEIIFYKNETITSNNFAKELLDAYKVIELDGKTSLSLGDAGIPELTDEEIKSLRLVLPSQKITVILIRMILLDNLSLNLYLIQKV